VVYDAPRAAESARAAGNRRIGASGRMATGTNNKEVALGFEAQMWAAADKLRGSMDASEYKHVVLGLLFLKYISDAFEELHKELDADLEADPEERDEYTAANVFWVPKEARWEQLRNNARQPTIGVIIDNAMTAIERENRSVLGVLPRDYGREALDKTRLGELVDLVSNITVGDRESRSKDVLGRVYEYFLGQFASQEGRKGGLPSVGSHVMQSDCPDIVARGAHRPGRGTAGAGSRPGAGLARLLPCVVALAWSGLRP